MVTFDEVRQNIDVDEDFPNNFGDTIYSLLEFVFDNSITGRNMLSKLTGAFGGAFSPNLDFNYVPGTAATFNTGVLFFDGNIGYDPACPASALVEQLEGFV